MKDVAVWLWGAAQASAILLVLYAIRVGVPVTGASAPWSVTALIVFGFFGGLCALYCLVMKFIDHWDC